MNRKGQALVEFVLILPVFILLVFACIDAGKIILCKSHLEGVMNEVVLMVDSDLDIMEINEFLKKDSEYKISVSLDRDKYTNIILKTKLDLITPGINHIFSENIKVERSIIHE